ncbi:MAG: cbb3-type cytochrome c oxidase subunit 3 [Deltaproteobacteria bacterium]|nr:cbb3-type cytochrome c oxidase subunit 3 [Deltaproteobacteria bacterium]
MEEFTAFSKSAVLVYFFIIFCAVSFWALRRKNRERLESHREIPFREDQ